MGPYFHIPSSIFNFISIHKYFASTVCSIAVACTLVPMGLDTPLRPVWPGFGSVNMCLAEPDCAGPNWASMVCIAGPAQFGLVLAWHGLVQFAVYTIVWDSRL